MEDRILAEGITEWLNRDISKGTVRFYEKPVMNLLEFTEGYLRKKPWRRDITRRVIKAWISHRKERISRTTFLKEWNVISNLFRCLSEGPEKIYKENPLSGIEVSRRNARPKPMPCLTQEQVRDLCGWLKKERQETDTPKGRIRHRQACSNEVTVSLFLATGITSQMMCDLKRSDFRDSGGKFSIRTWRSKTNRADLLPVDKRTGELLSGYLKKYHGTASPDDPLIMKKNRKGFSATEISERVARIIRKSGISEERMGAHGLRASHALLLFKDGKSLATIRKKLGHSDIKTTMLYLHRAMEMTSTEDTTVDLENPVVSESFMRMVRECQV
jgi:site-specific recombinase XerD